MALLTYFSGVNEDGSDGDQRPEGAELYSFQPGRFTVTTEQHKDKRRGAKDNHFDGVEDEIQRMAGEEAQPAPALARPARSSESKPLRLPPS